METIEERATNAWKNNGLRGSYMLGYIEGATEQDRIARQEERERCIKAAQDAHCRCCKWYEVCTSNGFDIKKTCIRCDQREQIRQAIEEGGEQ